MDARGSLRAAIGRQTSRTAPLNHANRSGIARKGRMNSALAGSKRAASATCVETKTSCKCDSFGSNRLSAAAHAISGPASCQARQHDLRLLRRPSPTDTRRRGRGCAECKQPRGRSDQAHRLPEQGPGLVPGHRRPEDRATRFHPHSFLGQALRGPPRHHSRRRAPAPHPRARTGKRRRHRRH